MEVLGAGFHTTHQGSCLTCQQSPSQNHAVDFFRRVLICGVFFVRVSLPKHRPGIFPGRPESSRAGLPETPIIPRIQLFSCWYLDHLGIKVLVCFIHNLVSYHEVRNSYFNISELQRSMSGFPFPAVVEATMANKSRAWQESGAQFLIMRVSKTCRWISSKIVEYICLRAINEIKIALRSGQLFAFCGSLLIFMITLYKVW